MATTGVAIQVLLAGLTNPTNGSAIASGRARFYQPGTLVARDVYSDDACASAISQPYTLGSGGEAKLFMLDPVRMIVKDSADSTTLVDCVLVQRADQVYITNTYVNGGAESTVDAAFTQLGQALGTGFSYKESSGADARSYQERIAEDHVSGKDFGAVGNGSTNDTSDLQEAIDRARDSGANEVYLPAGTYLHTGLTMSSASYAGLTIRGDGRATVLRMLSTTGDSITIATGAIDAKICIRDLTLDASTTTSGRGILISSGNGVIIERVNFEDHRTSIDASAVTGTIVRDCTVTSTDNNVAAVGISVGVRGRVHDCEVTASTGASGITLGADARASDSYANGWTAGITASGARCRVRDCHVQGSTTGIVLSGTSASARGCYVTGGTTGINITGTLGAKADDCTVASATTGITLGVAGAIVKGCAVTSGTTGVSVGAFANCEVSGCNLSSNTTDISVNASATQLREYNNVYSTISDATALGHNYWWKQRPSGLRVRVGKTTSSTGTNDSFTPDPENYDVHVYENTSGVNTAVTLNNTSTTNLKDGQTLFLVFYNNTASALTSSTNIAGSGTQWTSNPTPTGWGTARNCTVMQFVWRSSSSKWLAISAGVGTYSAGTSAW